VRRVRLVEDCRRAVRGDLANEPFVAGCREEIAARIAGEGPDVFVVAVEKRRRRPAAIPAALVPPGPVCPARTAHRNRPDCRARAGGESAMPVERIFVTPEEAAEALHIGRNLVYELMASGRLP